jgi:hypothetical protein
VILCVRRLSEDGTSMPKHVEVILKMNCDLRCVCNFIRVRKVDSDSLTETKD